MSRLEAFACPHVLLSEFEASFPVICTVSVIFYWRQIVFTLVSVFEVSEVRNVLVTGNTRKEVAEESSIQVPP